MEEKSGKAREALGLLGFLMLATAQVSNMILARGVAGSVPPFAIAFFRWSIVAIGLSPLIIAALRQQPDLLRKEGLGIAAAGFLGMFVCGGPVYLAGTTTSAINLALIMAMSPLMVLLFSLVMGLERVSRWQVIGMIIALSGAVLVITRGQASGEHGLTQGDILVLFAMMAWAGYTLVQNRIGSGIGFLARVRRRRRAVLTALCRTRDVGRSIGGAKPQGGKGLSLRRPRSRPLCLFRLFLSWLCLRRAFDLAQPLSRPRGRRGALDHLPRRGADHYSLGGRRAVARRHVAEPASEERRGIAPDLSPHATKPVNLAQVVL
jgi:EamA-like transporter family